MSLADRIPAELAIRLEGNPYRRENIYVQHGGHRILHATVCKGCGVKLTDTVPDPRIPSRRETLKDTDQKTVILETYVSRMKTSAFTTLDLEVEEPVVPFVPVGNETREPQDPRRGIHSTTMCKGCKKHLIEQGGPAHGQMIFDADLERMAIEDDVHNKPVEHTRDVLGKLLRRSVVRIIG